MAAGHRGALSAGKLSGITASADASDHGTTKGQRVPQEGAKNPVSKISSSKCLCKGGASQDNPPEDLCSSPAVLLGSSSLGCRLCSRAHCSIAILWSARSCSFCAELLLPPGFHALSFLLWNFLSREMASGFSPLESFTAGAQCILVWSIPCSLFFLHAQNPSVLWVHFPGPSYLLPMWIGSTLTGYLVPFGNPMGGVQGWEPNAS